LKKLGVEKVPPMVARGVLLDMAAYYGTDIVKEGTAFNVKEIEEVARKQGVEIRQGDVVIFHTGWLSLIGKDDKRYSTGEPGVGVEGANTSPARAWSPSAPIPGRSKLFLSSPKTSSRCIKSCCR
jgi:hypothetical protein